MGADSDDNGKGAEVLTKIPTEVWSCLNVQACDCLGKLAGC